MAKGAAREKSSVIQCNTFIEYQVYAKLDVVTQRFKEHSVVGGEARTSSV